MSRLATCPRCSTRISVPEGITDKTLICLRCLAEVNNPWQGSQIRAADLNTDVKRDVNGGCIVLGVLMGFCVLGVATAIGNPQMHLNDQFALLFFSCLAFVVLVCIAIIHWLVGRGSPGAETPRVENVLNTEERTEQPATDAQIPKIESVFGCILLVLGTIAAAIIFTFISCAVMWKPNFGK